MSDTTKGKGINDKLTSLWLTGPPTRRAARPEIPVKLRRVQTQHQGGVSEICRAVLLRVRRRKRQRARVSRGHTFLRRGAGSVLWERV